MIFLVIVLVLALVGLLILWLRVRSEAATLVAKLTTSEQQFTDLRAANETALRDAEASLAKEREDMEREAERIRSHFQSEAARLVEEMAKDVKAGKVKTVQGGEITVATAGGVTVDGAKVSATDIVADNGVIHVIDSVIFPK